MQYLGTIILLEEKDEYTKIVIGAEVGYETKYITARSKVKALFRDLKEGNNVLFTGETVTRNDKTFFNLDSIVKKDFEACDECDLPKTSATCMLTHKKEAQRLSGVWKVVHKIIANNVIKVFFDKCNFVFAAVATHHHWFNNFFKELKEGDYVELEGWRYLNKTSLRYLKCLDNM